ncbi:MAG: DUF928 domain-containing protein [Roseofilum sp. SBFL]|uniref:DUF928 domain-containing protein n=1 Tax=unclassified Roseofilum TaxID=2620099 RepID=UPI001B21A00D|nr:MULTISPECIES: DUF928 domain-containing protein [unclassified Roseofilum]MBP0015055.1 DUF928 domain-containing protein [Roseofilum sp. SID3]MBP0037982.1 DUF928 domain-containing protein [Roseofilum sp. SID1]MBP0041144.1 DUF928 domain-containing protein [Roseofilum sp. SBFL]
MFDFLPLSLSLCRRCMAIATITSLVGLSLNWDLSVAIAQTSSESEQIVYVPQLQDWEDPPPGLPSRRESAGSRTGCTMKAETGGEYQALSSIMPRHSFGLTTQASPTLYFYVPPNQSEVVEFALEDETGNEVYKVGLSLKQQSGLVAVNLADLPNSPSLEVNQVYVGYFQLNCNGQWLDHVATGIKRIPLEPMHQEQLTQGAIADQIRFYIQNGIWYDLLQTLIEAYPHNPSIPLNLNTLFSTQAIELEHLLPVINPSQPIILISIKN